MNTKRRIGATFAALSLVIVTAGLAYAETATVTVSGGTLSATVADVPLSSVTLDGTDQISTSASGSNSLSAQDSRGTGAGWNLTIDSTDFTDGGSPLRTIDISVVGQEFRIQLLDAKIGVTAGNTQPTSLVTALTTIPTTGVSTLKFTSIAADTGMGTYTMAPDFELDVAAETYVGSGTYTATITVTAGTGS